MVLYLDNSLTFMNLNDLGKQMKGLSNYFGPHKINGLIHLALGTFGEKLEFNLMINLMFFY